MLFSCKITHSVITYLDRRGEDLVVLYEHCDWPAEFLRDPSSWLEAEKMEILLKLIDSLYRRTHVDDERENLICSAGHACRDLRSWGVLDSVLRMVQTPKDLFAQPERFLSYFVSPAPPLGEIQRDRGSVNFVLPVSAEQFPFVTGYLRAALEGLPTYIAKPMASVKWDNSRVEIAWSEDQASLFGEASNAQDLSLHPELVNTIMGDLESNQKELDEMKLAIRSRDTEIERLRAQLGTPIVRAVEARVETKAVPCTAVDRLGDILHEIYRVGDYIARGQQLITLLVGQGRATPQVQEAMRRVDWEFVASAGPKAVRKAVEDLQAIQTSMQAAPSSPAIAATRKSAPKRPANLGFQGLISQEELHS